VDLSFPPQSEGSFEFLASLQSVLVVVCEVSFKPDINFPFCSVESLQLTLAYVDLLRSATDRRFSSHDEPAQASGLSRFLAGRGGILLID
jgi:hypothetical protein